MIIKERMMDRVILGDNQFFGVDHLSDENARMKEQKFKDTRSIIKVLDDAYDVGIRTFMCTTYARVEEICDHIRANPSKYGDFKIYPCMPYAHKYANAVTEMGILGTLKHYTGGNMAGSIVRGGMAVAQRDAFKLMQLLVDTEMRMFKGMNIEVIFLQNVVTDLLLGLGMYDFFSEFQKYVRKKYGAEAGFITMNLPMLSDKLESVGVENPIICASINKIGFRVSGALAQYEDYIANKNIRTMAMQVYAAGAIPPREALEFACGVEGVESILFGASSKANIAQTYEWIQQFDNQ
jgi:hypothetical protein